MSASPSPSPASTVEEIVTDLKDDGTVTRGWLGVQIQPVTEDIAASLGIDSTDGAIVADAQEDGPAAGAGIQAGDIITEVNGKKVKDPKELSETIARIEPKQRVTVTVLRDGRERDIEVTLGNLKDLDTQMQANADRDNDRDDVQPGSLDGLGLTVEENPDGEGVVVRGVADESPASQTGLQPGDIITAIGSEPVENVGDVEDGISAAQKQGRDAVLLKVQGENGTRFVGVPFERG
jgi:serine protease Do